MSKTASFEGSSSTGQLPPMQLNLDRRQHRSFNNNYQQQDHNAHGQYTSNAQQHSAFDQKQVLPEQNQHNNQQSAPNCNWQNFGQMNYNNLMRSMPNYNSQSFVPHFDPSIYSRMNKRERKRWRAQYRHMLRFFKSKIHDDDFNFGLDNHATSFYQLIQDEYMKSAYKNTRYDRQPYVTHEYNQQAAEGLDRSQQEQLGQYFPNDQTTYRTPTYFDYNPDQAGTSTRAHAASATQRYKPYRPIFQVTNTRKRGRKNDDMITFLANFVGTKIKAGIYPPKKKENLMTTVCRLIKTEAETHRSLHISEEQRERFEEFKASMQLRPLSRGKKHLKITDCQEIYRAHPELLSEYLNDLKTKDLATIEFKLKTKVKNCEEHNPNCKCRALYAELIDKLIENMCRVDARDELWGRKNTRLHPELI